MWLRRYVPGPILREGKNEVILLEVEHAPEDATSGGRALRLLHEAACMLTLQAVFQRIHLSSSLCCLWPSQAPSTLLQCSLSSPKS